MKSLVEAMLVVLVWTASCSKSPSPVHDAAVERVGAEAPPKQSDGAIALAVDFSVENCPFYDTATPTCTGPAPLTLRFVPIQTAAVTTYSWTFGDGGFANEPTPTYTYSSPGAYSVRLLVNGGHGPDDDARKIRDAFVVVTANPIGGACDSDVQCASGACICLTGSNCGIGISRGICAAACDSLGGCQQGQVCAGLRTAQPPSGGAAPWQASLCLLECFSDSDCPNGSRCRTLPPGRAGAAWVRGCFGDLPVDVGEPCSDASGALRDDLCSAGFCVALGVGGLCSQACDVASCPPGSDCAVLGDGRKLCLRPCTEGFSCLADPLLTCVIPGSGDLGYHLTDPSSANYASSYCAPRPCFLREDGPDDCLPAGVCDGDHCVQRRY